MRNLLILTVFAFAIIVPCYSEESSGGGISFMNMFNRFRRIMSGGEPVKPSKYVEIDFAENGDKPAVKVVRLNAMESPKDAGERLLKAPIVRASRHEVPKPEAVQKDLELGYIGPVVLNAEETKKMLKGSQYPGEDNDDDDDYWPDDDDDDDDYYPDDDDDDDYWPDYGKSRFAAKKGDPSVLTMSRKLAQIQKKKAHNEKKKGSADESDDDGDESKFAETHHLNSGEVLYHDDHHSHVYDEDEFRCPLNENGVYINLHHCTRYYICRGGRKTIVACHHGFSFDSRSRRCLPESIARC